MTDTITKPTISALLDVWCEDYEGDDIILIEDEVDGKWRHGSTHCAVFHRTTDDTHWAVDYRTNPSGDHNDFRDGDLDDSYVVQVTPHEKTVRTWKAVS